MKLSLHVGRREGNLNATFLLRRRKRNQELGVAPVAATVFVSIVMTDQVSASLMLTGFVQERPLSILDSRFSNSSSDEYVGGRFNRCHPTYTFRKKIYRHGCVRNRRGISRSSSWGSIDDRVIRRRAPSRPSLIGPRAVVTVGTTLLALSGQPQPL